MKKFTKLDEELLKENATATEKFNTHYNDAIDKLNKIKFALIDMRNEYEKNQGNWGYVGDIYHVVEELDNLCEFLNIKDVIDNSKKYNI